MLFGRLRLPGLLILLLLVTPACTSAGAEATPSQVGVAVASYTPPAGAPDFCAVLADGTDLLRVPEAMGTLAVSPDDVEARLHLGNAAEEVRAVLRQLDADGHPDVENALDDLAAALERAYDGTVTEAARTDVVTGLDAAGDAVQPVCEFPV